MEVCLGRVMRQFKPGSNGCPDCTVCQSRYFLAVAASTNWWYKAGMRLVLSMYRRCWGLSGAEEMFYSPAASLPATSARVLIGERGTPRYFCTCVMSIAGIRSPNTSKWGVGLTIHFFLFPSMSIRSEADFPSSPALISMPQSRNSVARSLSMNWRPRGVLVISAISSANAPEFTLLSPTETPSCGSKLARAQSIRGTRGVARKQPQIEVGCQLLMPNLLEIIKGPPIRSWGSVGHTLYSISHIQDGNWCDQAPHHQPFGQRMALVIL